MSSHAGRCFVCFRAAETAPPCPRRLTISLRMDGLYLYYPHRNVSPALRAVIDALKI